MIAAGEDPRFLMPGKKTTTEPAGCRRYEKLTMACGVNPTLTNEGWGTRHPNK